MIEQPELHLHPAFQEKLMKAFVMIATQTNSEIIIETHSETMINELGDLITKKVIEDSKVSILLCEKDDNDYSIVRETSFDSEGYIKKWPIGFFS